MIKIVVIIAMIVNVLMFVVNAMQVKAAHVDLDADQMHYSIRLCVKNVVSFIVVDRDGEEYKHFNKKDYDVKILDLVHPQKSNRYNSFVHIHNDTDVLSICKRYKVQNTQWNFLISLPA